jgi:hypothetical protein
MTAYHLRYNTELYYLGFCMLQGAATHQEYTNRLKACMSEVESDWTDSGRFRKISFPPVVFLINFNSFT